MYWHVKSGQIIRKSLPLGKWLPEQLFALGGAFPAKLNLSLVLPVADNFALHHVDGVFGDVCGQIRHPFNVLGHHNPAD